jgi:hypothetical protein
MKPCGLRMRSSDRQSRGIAVELVCNQCLSDSKTVETMAPSVTMINHDILSGKDVSVCVRT